jgi:branched-chain amino acid aminotransferase
VTPIRSVDDNVIGEGTKGPVTDDIQTRFFEVIEDAPEAYDDWFTPV